MLRILSRIVSPTTPKLHFLQNQPWLAAKFASTTSSSSSRSKGNSFAVSYLIDTCGFPPERAASVSKYLNLKTSEKPELAFEFFKSLGFSHSQVLSVFRGRPELLLANPEKSLMLKIEYFKSLGFSNSDILNIILRFAHILARSLKNEIIPSFNFLNNMFQSKHKLMKSVVRYPGILCDLDTVLLPNIKLLKEEGVPESHIVKFIEYFPYVFSECTKKLEEKVHEIKKLGFDPVKIYFVVAIKAKTRTSISTWARKEGIYRKWGWTDQGFSAAFKACPWCVMISDKKIEAVMDFLVNKLGYTSSAVVSYPIVLTMSLEKRIIPRGSVIQVLMSKGLIRRLSLSSVFGRNEKAFLVKFVYCHKEEADELLKLYHAKMALAR